MKYWNKQKEKRQHWTLVEVSRGGRWWELKLWCQRHESKGKFYAGPFRSHEWYFASPEDALVFKLTHGYK